MKDRQSLLFGLVALAAVGTFAGVAAWQWSSVSAVKPQAVALPIEHAPAPAPQEPTAPLSEMTPPKAEVPQAPAEQPQSTSPLPKLAAPKPRTVPPPAQPLVVTPELGRAALSYVGADPDAEVIWQQAINDTSIPAKVRKNLIEDLNEDGFPDPDHVTADDAPLIASRIALIEQIGPDAIDDVNFAAFQEAYKDLVKMYAKATRP